MDLLRISTQREILDATAEAVRNVKTVEGSRSLHSSQIFLLDAGDLDKDVTDILRSLSDSYQKKGWRIVEKKERSLVIARKEIVSSGPDKRQETDVNLLIEIDPSGYPNMAINIWRND
ncbi:MAG TPA: hypothetical protein PLK35_03545 [Candidatus Moranbacteria bacterium]|nr:hypothetical protein [Candidatus Moranbacteria bacterium]